MIIRLLLVVGVFLAGDVAAEVLPKRIKIGGEISYLAVPAGADRAVLYGVSEGNISTALQLGLTAPKGTKVKVEASLFEPKEEALKELKGDKEFFPVELTGIQSIQDEKKRCVEISAGDGEDVPPAEEKLSPKDYPPQSSPVCDAIPKKDRIAIRRQLEATYGGKWSLGNVCGFLVSVALNPDFGGKEEWCALYDWFSLLGLGINCFPDSFFAAARTIRRDLGVERNDFYGVIRKDACGKRKSKYLVRITLNFKGVDVALKESGFELSIRVKENRFMGGMEASIKPVSEGRYAPRPLIMMDWLGSACGNSLTLTKWSKGKPMSVTELPIYSFLIYKDLILGLSVADRVLKGGKGTFQLSDGFQAYGVCMALQKKRQKVNGYP